ncbi:DMT family transporter [Candidatus Woesearchaeota archaeon]|nr:DMT family transporter [Candidatus Woesearchaeota archaeon]
MGVIESGFEKKGLIFVLITAVVSGFSIFINSFGVKGFDSSVFTFSKNIVVALLLFSIILFFNQFNEIKKLKINHWKQLALIGLIGGSVPFLLFFRGLQMANAVTGSFIHKTLFVFAAVFAMFFLRERLTKGFVIGASLILLGTYLMAGPELSFSAGHIMILAAAVLWAAENVIAKHALAELSGNIVAFGRMFFGSLFILAFLIATGKFSIIYSMSFAQYSWIIITSLLLLLYVVTYYTGLKYVKVSTAASVLSLGAPITALLDLAFRGAALTAFDAAGIILISAGVFFIVYFAKILSSASYLPGVKHDERH